MFLTLLAGDEDALSLRARFPEFVFVATPDVSECLTTVRSLAIDGVLIQVAALRYEQVPLLRDLEKYRSVPIVLWGELSPVLAAAAVGVATWAHPKIVVERVDDCPERVRAFLGALPPVSTRRRLMRLLMPSLVALPTRIQSALHQAWEEPPSAASLKRVAARSGYSPRWIYGCLVESGFHTPHLLLHAHRLIHAWAYARDPGFTITEVAHKSGNTATRVLWRLCERMVGASTRDRLAELDESAFVDRIAYSLVHVP